MHETIGIVLSVFGLIGLGYAAARTRLLAASVGEGLSAFVFTVAIPLLLFRTLAKADLHGASPWRVWAVYFVGAALVWAAGQALVRRAFGRDARAGVVGGVSASYSNGVLIGVPLVHAVFGDAGMVFLLMIVSVHLPVMMLASILMNEWAARADGVATGEASRGESIRRMAATLARHPILIGIAAGGLWRMAGLELSGVLDGFVARLADVAGPVALFASGMSLQTFGVARQVKPAFALAAVKLLAMPALVLLLARGAGLPPLAVEVLTVTAACPTGVNAFLVASRFGTGQALASNAMLISTAGAVVTVAFWLTLLRTISG